MTQAMPLADFVTRYGGVYEHSPWVAERCWPESAQLAPDALAAAFELCVDEADRDTRLALIRAHPDLAGRAAVKGELTAESSEEQASAGIDQCTQQEFDEFQRMNNSYRQKFGFPFVMAVRNSNRHQILAAFAQRLQNDKKTEFDIAIREIHKIAKLRLQAMI